MLFQKKFRYSINFYDLWDFFVTSFLKNILYETVFQIGIDAK